MRPRGRVLVTLAIAAATVFAAVVSCSFPEVGFRTGELPTGPDGSKDAGDDNVEIDSQVLIDGSDPDALIVRDAGQKIDPASCAPSDCDCDKDGFRNILKVGCEGGLNDCDDNDSRTRPDQGYLVDPAEQPRFGDWNCADGVEPLYEVSVNCGGLNLGLGCNDIFGFEDQPGCGQAGTFVKCKPGGLSCAVGSRTPGVKQACK